MSQTYLNKFQRLNLVCLGSLHLFTDLVSAFIITSIAQNLSQVIVYNFTAFALQLPIGLLLDRWQNKHLGKQQSQQISPHQNKTLLGISLCLMIFSLIYMPFVYPLVIVICIGLANAIFHVSAGKQVIDYDLNHTFPTGFFVSFGAIGLLIGTKLASDTGLNINLHAILILICLVFIFLINFSYSKWGKHFLQSKKLTTQIHTLAKQRQKLLPVSFAIGLSALFFTIVFRSWLGLGLVFTWKTGIFIWLSVLAVFLGKICGGILADRFGWLKTALAGALLSLLGIYFAFSLPIFGLMALLCFQLPMAITLMALVHYLPKYRATAFGLNCLACFIGYLPIIYHYRFTQAHLGLIFLLCLVVYFLYLALSKLTVIKLSGEKRS